eukprot:3380511-Amphidinium_carterae.1
MTIIGAYQSFYSGSASQQKTGRATRQHLADIKYFHCAFFFERTVGLACSSDALQKKSPLVASPGPALNSKERT